MEFFRKDIIPNNTTIYIGGPEMLKRPATIKIYCFGIDNKEIEMFITKGKVAFIYDNQEKLEFTYEEFKKYCFERKAKIDPTIPFMYLFNTWDYNLSKMGCRDYKEAYPKALEEAKKETKLFLGKTNNQLQCIDKILNVICLLFMY